ncbi:MAG TPA: single-stranded DNA-binding protein [Terriglobales bacterium]|jgi:single-strand DNA-binding protein|nr:single-stranded DNA-binding protein [Terriglobales bacterium]
MEVKRANRPLARAEWVGTKTGQGEVSNSQSQSQRLGHRNEVHIAGVLAQEPEIRYTTTGKSVCNFTVATTYEKRTEYHRIVAWENQAEMLKRFHKDSFIKLAGRLQTRSYEKDGKKNWITEVVAWNLSDGTTERNAHGTEVSDADIPF